MQVALQSQAGANGPPKLYIMDDMALKVSVNMAGYIYIYNPACGQLPCIGTQTLFFWRCVQRTKESAVISNQLDHGVGQAFVNQCFLDIFQAEKLLLVCF